MRVLVTGAAGFIGSQVAEALIARGDEVVGIDCFLDYYARAVKERNIAGLRDSRRFTFVEDDLVTADLGRLTDSVDAVMHLAAQAGVRASWGRDFRIYADANVLATQRLLEACASRRPRFVYSSSSSIYGDAPDFPTVESTLPSPISPYGVTKLAGEHLCRLYTRSAGIPTISLRYFTVYGPRQRPDMAFHRFLRAQVLKEEIVVFDDGEQTRDFTYVGDVVAANVTTVVALTGPAVTRSVTRSPASVAGTVMSIFMRVVKLCATVANAAVSWLAFWAVKMRPPAAVAICWAADESLLP